MPLQSAHSAVVRPADRREPVVGDPLVGGHVDAVVVLRIGGRPAVGARASLLPTKMPSILVDGSWLSADGYEAGGSGRGDRADCAADARRSAASLSDFLLSTTKKMPPIRARIATTATMVSHGRPCRLVTTGGCGTALLRVLATGHHGSGSTSSDTVARREARATRGIGPKSTVLEPVDLGVSGIEPMGGAQPGGAKALPAPFLEWSGESRPTGRCHQAALAAAVDAGELQRRPFRTRSPSTVRGPASTATTPLRSP